MDEETLEHINVVALIPCRDGQDSIEKTIKSILEQTVRTFVVVADDASVDNTPKILENLAKMNRLRYVRYPRRESKNYARVPVLLNMAFRISPQADFYLISGDDCYYPANYCETLIRLMKAKGVDISSGYIREYNSSIEPSGSGRIITSNLINQIMPLPNSIGWESWMLYKALYLKRKVAVFPIKFEHNRKYSLKSTWTFGQSAYVNGVPLLFTLFRVFKNILLGEMEVLNSISILLGHLEYFFRRVEKLEIAPFVRDLKMREIKAALTKSFCPILR